MHLQPFGNGIPPRLFDFGIGSRALPIPGVCANLKKWKSGRHIALTLEYVSWRAPLWRSPFPDLNMLTSLFLGLGARISAHSATDDVSFHTASSHVPSSQTWKSSWYWLRRRAIRRVRRFKGDQTFWLSIDVIGTFNWCSQAALSEKYPLEVDS